MYSKNKKELKEHWIFSSVVPGKNIFEEPSSSKMEDVKLLLEDIKEVLQDFKPFNEKIYSQIYPNWKEFLGDMRVLLIVGAPEPYDAMVRTYEGREYIIFDLIRFNHYIEKGFDVKNFIRKMITHETSHLCIKKYHSMPKFQTYMDILKYITFDEGFAHLLAFEEGIDEKEYEVIIDEHYGKVRSKLREALEESNTEKQRELLIESNSGAYWDNLDEEGALRMVWYAMDKALCGADSYESVYDHIVMGNDKRLINPMVTEVGKRLWEEKKRIADEFTQNLCDDVMVEEFKEE